MRQSLGHFEQLRSALSQDAAGGFSSLTQRALGTFGELYAERRLHTEPRFEALQDVVRPSLPTCRIHGSNQPLCHS